MHAMQKPSPGNCQSEPAVLIGVVRPNGDKERRRAQGSGLGMGGRVAVKYIRFWFPDISVYIISVSPHVSPAPRVMIVASPSCKGQYGSRRWERSCTVWASCACDCGRVGLGSQAETLARLCLRRPVPQNRESGLKTRQSGQASVCQEETCPRPRMRCRTHSVPSLV